MRLGPRRALILASALVLLFAARGNGEAMFVSRTAWPPGDDAAGGWSGIDVSPDGHRFSAITDRGLFTAGAFERDALGRIDAIVPGPIRALGNSADNIFRRDVHDAEGLAIAPDGRVLVSFEVIRRVLSYPDDRVEGPTVLPTHLHFIGTRGNQGLEALAIGPDGALYTVPEFMPGASPFPVFRFDGAAWQIFARVEKRGEGFAPVGADVGPDGRFYLLERKLVPAIGFASRVRRYEITDGGFGAEAVLLTTRPGTHDNLEGLAVWRHADGRLRLTMISDDNFGPLQKTEIVEYALRE